MVSKSKYKGTPMQQSFEIVILGITGIILLAMAVAIIEVAYVDFIVPPKIGRLTANFVSRRIDLDTFNTAIHKIGKNPLYLTRYKSTSHLIDMTPMGIECVTSDGKTHTNCKKCYLLHWRLRSYFVSEHGYCYSMDEIVIRKQR